MRKSQKKLKENYRRLIDFSEPKFKTFPFQLAWI